MKIGDATRYHRAGGLLASDLGDEFVILDPRGGLYYGLNAVGARIWDLLATPCTRGVLADALLAEFEVEPKRLASDLDDLLAALVERRLVEVTLDAPRSPQTG
jgi:hypothetical protein